MQSGINAVRTRINFVTLREANEGVVPNRQELASRMALWDKESACKDPNNREVLGVDCGQGHVTVV